MRTQTIVAKLWSIQKWLKAFLIYRKRVLNSRETASYLHTSVGYIYYLVRYYYLPHYKTKKNIFYFRRKEIDAWLKARNRIDRPLSESRVKTALASHQNG